MMGFDGLINLAMTNENYEINEELNELIWKCIKTIKFKKGDVKVDEHLIKQIKEHLDHIDNIPNS